MGLLLVVIGSDQCLEFFLPRVWSVGCAVETVGLE